MSLFNLEAKISLDTTGYNRGINEARSGLKNFSAWTVAKGQLIAEGIKAGGRALIGLTKQAISNYASYEQLVGGVETLFGAGGKSLEEYAEKMGKSVDEVSAEYEALMQSQATVLKNADEAYNKSGMSANAYMETVTGFSASLLQSLGGDTVKAAEIADMAIIDMSDNANKMGTTMESIKYAYQGFAKQNYTINLMSAA